MAPTINSPNVENYFIGKGIVYVADVGTPFTSPIDTNVWRDVGNVPELELTPNVERLDHFSSRVGTRLKDRSVVLEVGGTLRIVLEEGTAANFALALLGDVDEAAVGGPEVTLFSNVDISKALWFVGASEIGAKADLKLNRVDFAPSSGINFIGSDDWGNMEVEGELTAVNGVFGTLKITNVSDVVS